MVFEEWWKQIKTNYEVATAVIVIFEGIGQEAWQASRTATIAECAEIAEKACVDDYCHCATIAQEIRQIL